MKLTVLTLSVLFSVQCFGQKWNLNNVDKTKEYPYEYWFQFENSVVSNNFELKRKSGEHFSTIVLMDLFGETISFGDVRIKNLHSDTLIMLTTDINGKANVNLEKGSYSLTVSVIQYENQVFEFDVQNEQYIELNINIGQPKGTVYQVDSKHELTEEKLLDIMKCVKANPIDYHKTCVEKDKYNIMNHL